MNKEELAARIKATAYVEGNFVLRSGATSSYYLDKYLFETCPDILRALGEEFAKHVTESTTVIAGPELGGVALAVAAAWVADRRWIIVRNSKKEYGTGKLIEGVIKPNDQVLLVEDIATSGGQVLEAAKIIQAAGAKVQKIVAVIDREQGARENINAAGFEFASIVTKKDLGIVD